MDSNIANEWTAAKSTMTCLVFDSTYRSEGIFESGAEVKAPARRFSPRRLLVIDFDADLLQRTITCGFNGQCNGWGALQ